MSDPTASSAILFAAWLSSAVMALLGIEYFALVWGFGGAIFSLTLTPPETRKSALISVCTSALAGAALAGLVSASLGGGRAALIATAFLVAAGAKPIVSAGIRAIEARIGKLGGSDAPR